MQKRRLKNSSITRVSLGSLMYVAYAFEIGGLKSIFFCFLSNGR